LTPCNRSPASSVTVTVASTWLDAFGVHPSGSSGSEMNSPTIFKSETLVQEVPHGSAATSRISRVLRPIITWARICPPSVIATPLVTSAPE
jgi:hypothetical protein